MTKTNEMARPYYLIKRGKYYYCRLAHEKTYHSTKATSKSAAHEEAKKQFAKHTLVKDDKVGRIRLSAFAEGFFDQTGEWVRGQHDSDYSFSPNQSNVRNGHLQNWIIPRFGKRWMETIEPYEMRKWLQDLKLANGTKNAIISTLNIVFTEAQFRRYVKENPMDQVRRFSKRYRMKDAFTLEDIRVLFPRSAAALLAVWGDPKWAVLFYTMLTTGMRRGEAAALQWRHVVWEKRGILILQAVKAEKTIIGLPKNGDQRAVLLPAQGLALLRWWRDRTPFPEPEHFVFHGEWGDKSLYPDTITRNFEKALKRADFDKGGRRLTVHSLRHTYNTRLENVLPGEILRYMLGHRTAAMTEHYLHVTPEERLADYMPARKLIGKAWS